MGVPDNGSCAGQGGDSDGDGTCDNQDCEPNNPNLPTTPGTSCDDGDSNTINDVIQSDGCTCMGVPDNGSCAGQGGDSDGDGTCDNQDCEPNNPNLPTTPGTSCDDGDANTINDVIQSDGCTCMGTPDGGEPNCDNAIITPGNGSITISNLTAPIVFVKVFNSSWQTVFDCVNCNTTETVSGLNPGNYCVQIKYFTSSWSSICERLSCGITVTDGGGGCTNVTNGGTIGFGGGCTNSHNGGDCPIDPPNIANCQSPSGGSGTIQYVWLSSTTSSNPPSNINNDPNWSIISGATGATYNPGNITETTYYIRYARRSGCTTYTGASNVVAANCDSGGGSNLSLSCPNNITVTQTSPNGAVVTWSGPTANTSCAGGATINQTGGLPSGSVFPVGNTTVSFNATDNCGGSVNCSFVVTVQEDNGGELPTGYCASRGTAPWHEWIANVQFGNIDHSSAKNGYANNTNLSTPVTKGQSYNITLEPGFSWTVYSEHWRVWIDFNRDGDFEDAGEKVLEANSTETVVGSISIPASASNGATRMRVSMSRQAYADPCETFNEGEVEDYAVVIGDNLNGDEVEERDNSFGQTNTSLGKTGTMQLYPNPSSGQVQVILSDFEKEDLELTIYDVLGQVVYHRKLGVVSAISQELDLQALRTGVYWLSVKVDDDTRIVEKLTLAK